MIPWMFSCLVRFFKIELNAKTPSDVHRKQRNTQQKICAPLRTLAKNIYRY